jgi:hypothetical protein
MDGAQASSGLRDWLADFLRDWVSRASAVDLEWHVSFAYVVLRRLPEPTDPREVSSSSVSSEVGFGSEPSGPPEGVELPLVRLLQEGITVLG